LSDSCSFIPSSNRLKQKFGLLTKNKYVKQSDISYQLEVCTLMLFGINDMLYHNFIVVIKSTVL
jgi:hypothetical protein